MNMEVNKYQDEDRKIEAAVEQWINLLFAQIRRNTNSNEDKNENQKIDCWRHNRPSKQ